MFAEQNIANPFSWPALFAFLEADTTLCITLQIFNLHQLAISASPR